MLQKLKQIYILWFSYYKILDKTHRYTLGQRIDTLLVESIEAIAVATFIEKSQKTPYVLLALRKIDSIKILVLILWETKSLDTKKYIALSEKLEEIGKMLGGWYGQLVKQNSPATKTREK